MLAVGLTLVGILPAAAAEVAFTIQRRADHRVVRAGPGSGRGAYWTINDSGDAGVAYALRPNGEWPGTLNFRRPPRDVEAIALHENRLYMADIGDNLGQRDFVPSTSSTTRGPRPEVNYRAWDFRYPDGRHDAEALLVDDARAGCFLVTKQARGGAIYAAPPRPSRETVNDLKQVADAPSLVTDGTFLPGGDRIALLAPHHVSPGSSMRRPTSGSVGVTAPNQRQPRVDDGQSDDDTTLLVGSEGGELKVYADPGPTSTGHGEHRPAHAHSDPEPTPTPGEPSDGEADRRLGTAVSVGTVLAD